MDTLSDIVTELAKALKTRGYMLALAESCTGGMVAQAITSQAGSSAWFDRGFVTYSNLAKIEILGVLPQTLEKFGAVSEQVAREMAQGCLKTDALKNSHAHIAASITGIAGPDGGSIEKPVGTVCFAWVGYNIPIASCTKHFNGNRDEIRQQATATIMAELIKHLSLLKLS